MPRHDAQPGRGKNWRASLTDCRHGHDIRLTIDGSPNENVVIRPDTGVRVCVRCNRTRARLGMRVSFAARKIDEHMRQCCTSVEHINPLLAKYEQTLAAYRAAGYGQRRKR